MQSGNLLVDNWSRVTWGVGWSAIDYGVSIGAPRCRYRTYPNDSSGTLPRQAIH